MFDSANDGDAEQAEQLEFLDDVQADFNNFTETLGEWKTGLMNQVKVYKLACQYGSRQCSVR